MGQYLIPNAKSSAEASLHVPFGADRLWREQEGGVMFTDPNLTDAECAALYANFTPSGMTNDEYRQPLPEYLRTHLPHLKQYYDATAVTNAETVHVVKDLIRAVYYLNSRFEAPE